MASGDPRDPTYGTPYTGTPVQQASRDGQVSDVLDLNRKVVRRVTQSITDDHYTTDGDLYHE